MACDCIEKANGFLAPLNTRLSVRMLIERGESGGVSGLRETIELGVEKIAPRGKRPTVMLATFCPLCGVRYVPEVKESSASAPEIPVPALIPEAG